MYRSEYIVCFRSEISFVPLLFSHRTPFLRPYWQIYFNSTSNHNTLQNYHNAYGVVSYFHFTSNHNIRLFRHRFIRLFLISILHQTTTLLRMAAMRRCCFLFPFYIKPQQDGVILTTQNVVSYFHSTSNHNRPVGGIVDRPLFLISILHQTTTSSASNAALVMVVSYFHSTSNHNLGYAIC